MRKDRSGFTLIELIIVVVIVMILAGIAGPMMTGFTRKARTAEAYAALGAIRTAQRLHLAAGNASYVNFGAGGLGGSALNAYISDNDVNGRYYNSANYAMSGNTIQATGSSNTLSTNMDVVTGAIYDCGSGSGNSN